MLNGTITAKLAAIEANCYPQQIYDAIRRGQIKARRIMGRVEIDRASFEVWRARLEKHRQLRQEMAGTG